MALRDLVTVHARGRALAPVARLRTDRHLHRLTGPSGAVVVQVADDHMRAETATTRKDTWREVGVKLVDDAGEEICEAVTAQLHHAGARPADRRSKLSRALGDEDGDAQSAGAPVDHASAGDVVRAYLIQQVDALIDADPSVRLDRDDAVHKMRVAVRRLRSALATYRRLLDQDLTEPVRDELKWLGGALGPARDAEVIRDHLRRAADDQPPALTIGPVRRRIVTTLGRDHRDAHAGALAAMTSPRYVELLESLDRLGNATRGKRSKRPARKILSKEVGRAHRRMQRQLAEALAGDGPTDEQLHEVRKAVKRVRYAAESVSDVFGTEADALADQMEAAQELLGAHQDTVVTRAVLRRLATDAARAGENTFTYGRLHACEECSARAATHRFLASVDTGWGHPPSWVR